MAGSRSARRRSHYCRRSFGSSCFGGICRRTALVSCTNGFAQAVSLTKLCGCESADTVSVCFHWRVDVFLSDGSDKDPTLHSKAGRGGVSAICSHHVWAVALGRRARRTLWLTNSVDDWTTCCSLRDCALRDCAASRQLLGHALPGSSGDGAGHDYQCRSLDYDSDERRT